MKLNIRLLVIILFLSCVSVAAAAPEIWVTVSGAARNQDDSGYTAYINKWSSLAVSEMHRSGIPASITLAQGIVESNAGKSTLAVKANNHFGIKCHNTWAGAKVYHDDDSKGECFRKYARAEDSFKDHSDFLRYRDRYKFLFDLEPTDYKGWAYGLKKAGYATDPNYPAKIISVIERYALDRFDLMDGNVPESPAVLEQPVLVEDASGFPEFTFSVSRKIYSQNKVPFVYAEEGDTYSSLAKRYNLFTRELKKFNDTSADAPQPGEPVYLQPKKSKAAKGVYKHIVDEGETLRSIAQRYGVKMSKLKKMNKLNDSDVLRDSDVIILRK